VQRSVSSGDSTTYVYDGQDVIKDINSDGSTVEYLNEPGIDNKLRQTSSSTTLYFVHDHLGSARALTDENGNLVESIDYDSFGNGASNLTRYGYTGREWEAEANLYYYRARWYDPQVGRFISEDPVGFQGGVNWYAYVGNNPTGFVDPSGLNPFATAFEFGKVGAALGGVPGAFIGAGLGIVVGYLIWQTDCAGLAAGVGRLITPYITSKTSDDTRTIPLAPPMPPLPRDNEWEEVTVYRGLKATNPGEFKGVSDEDGLSAYEVLNPGNYKLALPFTIKYRRPKLAGTIGTVVVPAFPGATAEYTPQYGDPRVGIGHWSLRFPGEVGEIKKTLSAYAKMLK
jgi:RHS repeat-associated protein